MTDPTTTDWRDRGKARLSERLLAVSDLWINQKVSLVQAERIVRRWEFTKWLIEQGKVTR